MPCTEKEEFRNKISIQLAGHPLRGWPARLRGHKGSGLWKVWTVPSPPLPSPPLPSPPLSSPPLPSLPPSLPPSFPPSLPLACHVAETAISRICRSGWASVAPPGDHGVKTKASAMIVRMHSETVFFEVELRELWFESGLMNGPVHDLKGKWSECHRVRNAKRPREGSNSRTVPYYYIDNYRL